MPNDATEFDLDMVNFSKYIRPIINVVVVIQFDWTEESNGDSGGM